MQPLIEVIESEEILMEPSMQAVIPVSEPDVTQVSPNLLTNPFADLFAAWSIEVEPLFSEEEVFALAEINNLCAEKLTDAENLQLVAIDRPGIIWIKEDNGRLKSHLLMALDDDSVLLKTDSGDRRESLQWFNERWNGAYLFLWHSPSDIKSLRLGDKDSIALDWVQSQLQLIDANYLPFITGGNYTEVIRNRVLDFQMLQGIKADGVVGRQTIMRLNQLADPNIPRLRVVELEEGNL
jgi:general secretion pathway protein A